MQVIDTSKTPSPANTVEEKLAAGSGITERTRIPLGGTRAKLAVPKIPGYHTHWFLDKNGRIEAAALAGYEFVEKSEVSVPNHSIAGDRSDRQGTALGSRVSIVAGADDEAQGQPARLVLMKLRQEWRDADMKSREEANDKLVAALRNGSIADREGGDPSGRYTKPSNRTMFTKRS